MPLGRHRRFPRYPRGHEPQWLTLQDAAHVARVTPSALRREILMNGMPARKTETGWTIHREVLDIFIQTREARRVAASQHPRDRVGNGE